MLLALAPLLLAAAPAKEEVAVNALIDAFLAAEAAYDAAALDRLTAPDYVEISPKGEVDERARFLGFYAPDKKVAAPPLTVSERRVRIHGDHALAIVTLGYAIPGRPAPIQLRATYAARRTGATWRMTGAQFTPVRP